MENLEAVIKNFGVGGAMGFLFYKLFKTKTDEETRQNSLFLNNVLEQNKSQTELLEKTINLLLGEIEAQRVNQEMANKNISSLVTEFKSITNEVTIIKNEVMKLSKE